MGRGGRGEDGRLEKENTRLAGLGSVKDAKGGGAGLACGARNKVDCNREEEMVVLWLVS